nr:hypothetical protein [uncultured Schaedlerella sp.]
MYPVSDAFLQAVKANTRKYYWTGRITAKDGVSYDFGQQDIVKGSGYISCQCCENSEITIGGVYAAEAGLSLITEIDRYTLLDASLSLTFHLLLADGTYEEVPMGIFFVSEADRHVKAIDIKCYDAMLKFDKGFSAFGTSGNAYDFMTLASVNCGVALAQERVEIEAMANGAVTLGIAEDNDIETYRDLLYYVAQVLGGFFTIDREGKLELRKFGASPVLAVEQAHRFSSSISDFVSSYTAISSTNLKTQVAEYYALEHDTGLTMNLGVNPLMQLGTEDARKLICGNILNDVAAINYVPFDTETIGNLALDLGDVLTFRGGQADENKTGVVTSMRVKIGGKQALKGVGKNPRLTGVKSKNDKNISGLLNSLAGTMEAAKYIITDYSNSSVIVLKDGVEKKLVSLAFAASERAESAQFFAQAVIMVADTVPVVKSTAAAGTIHIPGTDAGGEGDSDIEISLPVSYELPGEAAVTFRFVVNGEAVLMHQPAETWREGRHTALLYWPLLKLAANQQNRVELYAKISGGSGSIGMQGLVATVAGQSLAGAGWDGTVSIEESMKAPVLVQGFLHAGTFQDRFVSGEFA